MVVPNAFSYAGVKIKYCDIELQTYGLDIEDIKRKVTPDTKAILLQHLYGLVCRDYEKIIEFAKQKNIYVIEDCAHSTGAEFKGGKVGNLGDAAFYSLEHSKVLTTFNGGVTVTNNSHIAKRIEEYQKNAPYPDESRMEKILYNIIYDYYAYKHKYNWILRDMYFIWYSRKILDSTTSEELRGIKPIHYGQKMPEPVAAVGLNQLRKLDDYNQKRRENAKIWDNWCEENGFEKPLVISDSIPIFLRYPVMVTKEMKKNHSWAKNLNIPIGVWFITNVHPSKFPVTDCQNADKAVAQCINFPTLGLE